MNSRARDQRYSEKSCCPFVLYEEEQRERRNPGTTHTKMPGHVVRSGSGVFVFVCNFKDRVGLQMVVGFLDQFVHDRRDTGRVHQAMTGSVWCLQCLICTRMEEWIGVDTEERETFSSRVSVSLTFAKTTVSNPAFLKAGTSIFSQTLFRVFSFFPCFCLSLFSRKNFSLYFACGL